MADTLERVPPDTELHIDFEHLSYIDHACLELFINWEKQHEATGGSLVIDWESLHARFRSPRAPAGVEDGGPPPGANGRAPGPAPAQGYLTGRAN